MSARRTLLALALAAACVPRTQELEPRGAIGVVTVPSAASRGEPFRTTDGWTVRVESLVLLGQFAAAPGPGNAVETRGRSGEVRALLFRASEPNEAVVRAVGAGPAFALVDFEIGLAIYAGGLYVNDVTRRIVRAVDAEAEARFRRIGDDEQNDDCAFGDAECFRFGPSYHLVASAERDGRRIRIDFAGRARFRYRDPTATDDLSLPVVVRANTISRVEASIEAEAFFTNEDHALAFDDLAAADADGDGLLTAKELHAKLSRIPRDDLFPPDPEAVEPADADAGADGGPDADAGADAGAPVDERPPQLTMLEVLTQRAHGVFRAKSP